MVMDEAIEKEFVKKHNKRQLEGVSRDEKKKKVRLFSAKEFLKDLHGDNKSAALSTFLQLITTASSTDGQDVVSEYLVNGGTCLDILQILDTGTVAPFIILEIAHHLLLRISANYPRHLNSAQEACRYLLNSHIATMNKMLNLSSSVKERKVILKLLTTVLMVSNGFAKDILLHVNFNPTNLELLTKPSSEKDSVRNAFIHFLMAFLVDGNFSMISVLLEKRGLLSSIVSGLQYDFADTVCIVMATLKNHLLENPVVSKTTKMKTFSTPVVRDIVNLYNWKGPEGYNPEKKKEKHVNVDELEKSQVNEAVHSFLLVLCTSYKNGVIFKDPLLGLGKKKLNSLMYTVLESLERPWEHSYASDLVLKICGACPDLVKTTWTNLKQHLEPRLTEKWIIAIDFSKKLLKQVEPKSIEIFVKDLTVTQVAQLIQCFAIPTVILKVLINENFEYEKHAIKHLIILLLVDILKSVKNYLTAARLWFSKEKFDTLKNLLSDHINRQLPSVENILKGWNEQDADETALISYGKLDHLEACLDLFDLYKSLSPQLLDKLTFVVDLQKCLQEVDGVYEEMGNKGKVLKLKAVSLFMEFEPTLFNSEQELFERVLLLGFDMYYNNKNEIARNLLCVVLKNTSIFEGCKSEIRIWIDAIMNLKNFDKSVPKSIVAIIRLCISNMPHYLKELSVASEEVVQSSTKINDVQEILKILDNDEELVKAKIHIKHTTLSPLLLAAFDYFQEVESTKSIKVYFNFFLINLLHLQTNPAVLINIVDKNNCRIIYDSILHYVISWKDSYSILEKIKGRITTMQQFSSAIFANNMEVFLKENTLNSYCDERTNLLQMTTFYITNLAKSNSLTKKHTENCLQFVRFLLKEDTDENFFKTVFGHPFLLNYFSPLHVSDDSSRGICTDFIVNVVKEMNTESTYLSNYRTKLISALKTTLRKSSKAKNVQVKPLIELIKVVGVEYEQYFELFNFVLKIDVEDLVDKNNMVTLVFNVIVTILGLFVKMQSVVEELKPLHKDIVQKLLKYLQYLNQLECNIDTSDFAKNLSDYLERFPHHFTDINTDVFQSIIAKEYCKENSNLAALLFNFKTNDLLPTFENNIESICNKKGLFLPLLEVLVDHDLLTDELVAKIYEHFKPALLKALEKPHKSKHFEKYYKAVGVLLGKIEATNFMVFVEKVHKYEVSETFHAYLLEAVFEAVIKDSEKHLTNAILTFVHLCLNVFKKKTKTDSEWTKLEEITQIFESFITKLTLEEGFCKDLSKNESFQLYCKFCLKFGLSNSSIFLKILQALCRIVKLCEDDCNLFMEMIVSHSEFLEVALSDDNNIKAELFGLFLLLCKFCPNVLKRNHMPLLLAAYQGTLRKSDRNILSIIKICETIPAQTGFYEFKPFLWGRTAATYYSVRSEVQKVLWRQPKMRDVLNILQNNWISNTIKNCPLKFTLKNTEPLDYNMEDFKRIYDFAFILPLFSQLLALENDVQMYIFNKSGALSLTIVALSSQDREVRLAACHILSRYYYHLEGNQRGKDHLLWLRFIDVVCRGVAVTKDLMLNNFAGIFLAKMATILTQPLHVMYVPLSQYLGAKANLDLSGIPELYTLLHSPDVNYKEHQKFILKIIRDGLRSEKDFRVALHSMAFKLIMELFSSCTSDVDLQILILKIIEKASYLPHGIRSLCSNHGLLTWLHTITFNLNSSNAPQFLPIITNILVNILKLDDTQNFVNIILMIVACIIDKHLSSFSKNDDSVSLLKLILKLVRLESDFLSESQLNSIISVFGDKTCNYVMKFGCKSYQSKINEGDLVGCVCEIVFSWKNKHCNEQR